MDPGRAATATATDFRAFVEAVEPTLRAAFVGMYGAELGREATAEALAYAWTEWSRPDRSKETPRRALLPYVWVATVRSVARAGLPVGVVGGPTTR